MILALNCHLRLRGNQEKNKSRSCLVMFYNQITDDTVYCRDVYEQNHRDQWILSHLLHIKLNFSKVIHDDSH